MREQDHESQADACLALQKLLALAGVLKISTNFLARIRLIPFSEAILGLFYSQQPFQLIQIPNPERPVSYP